MIKDPGLCSRPLDSTCGDYYAYVKNTYITHVVIVFFTCWNFGSNDKMYPIILLPWLNTDWLNVSASQKWRDFCSITATQLHSPDLNRTVADWLGPRNKNAWLGLGITATWLGSGVKSTWLRLGTKTTRWGFRFFFFFCLRDRDRDLRDRYFPWELVVTKGRANGRTDKHLLGARYYVTN